MNVTRFADAIGGPQYTNHEKFAHEGGLMAPYIEVSPTCRNYGAAVKDFILTCANHNAMAPVEHWRRLHQSVARLYASAVDYSLVEGMKIDWPACLRRRRDLRDELKKYQLDIEPAIEYLSGSEPRTPINSDLLLHEPMQIYSNRLTVLLNELRCSLLDVHSALLVGYSWWLEGHPDDEMRACECWRDTFEKRWGTPALSFLRMAAMLSSAQGRAWLHDRAN